MMAVEAPNLQRGGRRPGAGRPPELATQLAEAKKLAAQLRLAIRGGLFKLANEYESLLEVALDLAKKGDTRVLLHLLDLPAKVGMNLNDDERESRASRIAAAVQVNVNGTEEVSVTTKE